MGSIVENRMITVGDLNSYYLKYLMIYGAESADFVNLKLLPNLVYDCKSTKVSINIFETVFSSVFG